MYKAFFLLALLAFGTNISSQVFEEMTDISGLRSPGNNFGISIADVNSDGFDDIYVSRRNQTNLLYINQGNFSFDEQGEKYGLAFGGNNQAAIWLDFDNDKDLDFFMVNNGSNNQFYKNEKGVYENKTYEVGLLNGGFVKSVNAVDYDNDGFLDLYVAYFLQENVLYKNIDGEYFLNATVNAGISDTGPSMGSVFFDYDNDGDQDLYQVHDSNVPNKLYRNLGNGKFEDVSVGSKADYAGLGMGVDAGDVNNDGYLDLYITNLRENTLLINKQDGTFENVASLVGVDDIGMGWGTFIFDSDNDGFQDIYVANESNFGVQGHDVLKNVLFKNQGNLTFSSESFQDGIQNVYGSYGAAYSDFDRDGRLDFVVANQGDVGNQIFHNITEKKNFITFHLIGTKSNFQGIGARVNVYAGGNQYIRERKAGSSWISQSGSFLHFGLDADEVVDSVLISWPSGEVQKFTDYSINSINVVSEPSEFSSGQLVWTEPAFPTQFDNVTVYFDAKEGNGGLANFEGAVYAHTGVITSQSNSPSDWKYVQGIWGIDFPKTKMINEGNDIYSISFNINEFYGVNEGELVEKLAFVFRNVDGSVTGRDVGGGDIFLDVYPPQEGLFALVTSPLVGGEFLYKNDTLTISASTNQKSKLDLYDNSALIFSDSILDFNYEYLTNEYGLHTFDFVFSLGGDTVKEMRQIYLVDDNFERLDAPADQDFGVNYFTDSTLIFKLFAPNKRHVFFLTYANDFMPVAEYRMRQSTDGSYFWIELPKDIFIQGVSNAYIYFVNVDLIADPYSTIILDPFNDQWVPEDVMAELPVYPTSRLQGMHLTVFDVEKSDFPWTDEDYNRPDQSNLVIYELLMRDFLSDRNYKSLLDTLDYFQKLGVTAIELMPINEFESNGSWGYNPSFHMAVDKEYGSKDQLRAVINEAHSRGIAVILDVVYNHVFSQSPLARLYWDDTNFRPTPDNPYLNVIPKHPFNVGYDVNHESEASKLWVKQTLQYWLEEFHIDGFRFDLSKGFTQTNSAGDDVFRQYDPGRIATLKDYADFIWSFEEDAYVILEHFAANDEEKELANYGMMLWGNMNHQFIEAAQGRSSDLEWADYTVRGWDNPNIVAYMESHDEERMMVRILDSGLKDGNYDTRDPEIALKRVAAAAAIFYSIPGPKMLWQFGEFGYDYSINWCTNGTVNGCRLDPKPVKWDYLEEEGRAKLFDITSNILHLKKNYPTFSTSDFVFRDGNFFLKTVHLNHEEMDAVVMANYRVTNSDINPKFQNPGVWYEYFTGDSLIVDNTEEKITHLPGEYRIYTSKRITPPNGFVTNTSDFEIADIDVFPNPVLDGQKLHIEDESLGKVEKILLMDNLGRLLSVDFNFVGSSLQIEIPSRIPSGRYYLQILGSKKVHSGSFVKI